MALDRRAFLKGVGAVAASAALPAVPMLPWPEPTYGKGPMEEVFLLYLEYIDASTRELICRGLLVPSVPLRMEPYAAIKVNHEET